MKYTRSLLSLFFCSLLLVRPPYGAGRPGPGALAPSEITGKAVYIPFPVTITLDGKLDDLGECPASKRRSRPSVLEGSGRKRQFPIRRGRRRGLSLRAHAGERQQYHSECAWGRYVERRLHGVLHQPERKPQCEEISAATSFSIASRPADIDNADPTKLNVSGSNFDLYPLKAKVFKTKDGWGFEGAVKISPKVVPAHGKEIGFQAQLNGASVKDRDVKLIWSLADTSDNSWQKPSLFGRALFFKVGSADVPKPSEAPPEPAPVASAEPVAPILSMNQVGYFPKGKKIGSLAGFCRRTSQMVPRGRDEQGRSRERHDEPGRIRLIVRGHAARRGLFLVHQDRRLLFDHRREPEPRVPYRRRYHEESVRRFLEVFLSNPERHRVEAGIRR